MMILHDHIGIIVAGIIISFIVAARMMVVIIKHLQGMIDAAKIYSDIGIPTDIMICTPWRDVAVRMVDRGILDVDSSFGGEVESISRAFVDAKDYLPSTRVSIDILRRSLHRSLRSAIPLRFSLFIEGCKELVLWPINTLERLTDIIIANAPVVYSSPRELIAYVFRPTIVYTHRGIHEMHFEASAYFDKLTTDANIFLSEFPSPLLDVVYRIIRVPVILAAGFFLYHRMFEMLVVCVTVFGVISQVSLPGRLDPSAIFEDVNRRFKADDANHLRKVLGNVMRRRAIDVIIELMAIIISPIMAWNMMSDARVIYDVILRRISIIDGEVGMCMSTRVYRHVTMLEDTRGMTTSQMMMFDEFDGLMGRAEV